MRHWWACLVDTFYTWERFTREERDAYLFRRNRRRHPW